MPDILKYKGPIGNHLVELELPLGLAIGTITQQKLLEAFAEWLIAEIPKNY